MQKMMQSSCTLCRAVETNPGIYDFTVTAPEIAAQAQPGQFVHIYVPGHTLRRPISIAQTDKAAGTLRLVFQIRGRGTDRLAQMKTGEALDIIGPLGNGFPLPQVPGKVLLVGGGIGVPPLLGLAAHYKEQAVACLGFRSADGVILAEDFKRFGAQALVATEDGTAGEAGYVSALFPTAETVGCVFACGPQAMLKAVCSWAAQHGDIPCYISLEERMACGIGACLGCACGLVAEDGSEYFGHVCKDGPVFDWRRVSAYRQMGEA